MRKIRDGCDEVGVLVAELAKCRVVLGSDRVLKTLRSLAEKIVGELAAPVRRVYSCE